MSTSSADECPNECVNGVYDLQDVGNQIRPCFRVNSSIHPTVESRDCPNLIFEGYWGRVRIG